MGAALYLSLIHIFSSRKKRQKTGPEDEKETGPGAQGNMIHIQTEVDARLQSFYFTQDFFVKKDGEQEASRPDQGFHQIAGKPNGNCLLYTSRCV